MSSRHPWRGFINASDEKPAINREILKRVWQYAKPYLGGILGSLSAILITTLLNLLNPLIMRQLVDVVLPNKDTHLLALYAGALFVVPLVSGAFQLVERYLSARVGEGVIFDLRVALYDHFQSMPLHFFVNTPLGEMISRLNNDVVEAQNGELGDECYPSGEPAGGDVFAQLAADFAERGDCAALCLGSSKTRQGAAAHLPSADGSECAHERQLG